MHNIYARYYCSILFVQRSLQAFYHVDRALYLCFCSQSFDFRVDWHCFLTFVKFFLLFVHSRGAFFSSPLLFFPPLPGADNQIHFDTMATVFFFFFYYFYFPSFSDVFNPLTCLRAALLTHWLN